MTSIYPGAVWRQASNHSGPMEAHLGLILHVQVGNGSIFNLVNNKSNDVSYTWWVSKSGLVEQYVDAELTAWAQAGGNRTYNSVGTEGYPTEALTDAQIEAVAGIWRWGADLYGWPAALIDRPGDRGFGWHGMGDSNGNRGWGGHPSCPGDIRKAQRTDILARAGAGPVARPAAQPGATSGNTSAGSAPPFGSRVLRLTQPNMTGGDVRTWQLQMRSRGWRIDADGFFGPRSAEVCRKFQAEKSLDVDGAVGPATWRASWESAIT